MAKILSFNSKSKLEKDNIFVSLWESFQSLSFFVRFLILTAILVILSTPFIVGNIQIFIPHAQTPSSYNTRFYSIPAYRTSLSGGYSDLNSDSKVNIFDLSILLRNWGK